MNRLPDEWGVRIGASPNHRMAKGHWPDGLDTDREPEFDYDRMVATIAFETDQHVELIADANRLLGVEWTPSDGELLIDDETAECWLAAPETVFGVDVTGKLLATPSDRGIILRNDIQQLWLWMAGAISRYLTPRAQAEVVFLGWGKWNLFLGTILTTLDEGGTVHQIQSPTTSVQWSVEGEAATIVRARV